MTTTQTYAEAATRVGADVPEHLDASWDIPKTRGGIQGDVMARPLTPTFIAENPSWAEWFRATEGVSIAGPGISVVEGDIGRNSHILSCFSDGGARYLPDGSTWPSTGFYGYLWVPPGETAELIHTAEHGAISLTGDEPDGTYYELRGQLDPQTATRVAD